MAGELIAGLGALKTAFDMAKGLKDINDGAIRNAAVIELQEKILTAQAEQSSLIQRISDLEKEVAGFEKWDAEKERYALADFGGNTFAYALKQDAAKGEPPHRICPACYQNRTKSILQFRFTTQAGQDKYICPACKTEFDFGHRRQPPHRGY